MIGRLLPGAIKQPLADLISSTPDSIRQVVDSLPGDLQLVCSTPEGLVLLFATVVAGLFLLLVLAKPAKRKGRSILLVGPCNAGKTTLFYQLKDGELHHGSVASMQVGGGGTRMGAGPCMGWGWMRQLSLFTVLTAQPVVA